MTLDELIRITYPLANLDFEQRVQLAEKAAVMINANNKADASKDGRFGYPVIVDPLYIGANAPDLSGFEGMNLTKEQQAELDDMARQQTMVHKPEE